MTEQTHSNVFDRSASIYALDKYSPVLVSILITSPWFTNNGTFTVAPVSTVAGLVAP